MPVVVESIRGRYIVNLEEDILARGFFCLVSTFPPQKQRCAKNLTFMLLPNSIKIDALWGGIKMGRGAFWHFFLYAPLLPSICLMLVKNTET